MKSAVPPVTPAGPAEVLTEDTIILAQDGMASQGFAVDVFQRPLCFGFQARLKSAGGPY
jgi:hypothetical protein